MIGTLSRLTLGLGLGVALLAASAASANQFGYAGANGRHGASGRDGMPGQSATVTADGTPKSFDLSGGHGTNGYMGEDGYYAQRCNQPGDVPYDLYGASGGSGGNGGSGGSGGDAGDLIVYYTDIAQLAEIAVRQSPGVGGRGAYGGRAAPGCRCSRRSWTVTSGEQSRTYHCRDGAWGYEGRNGYHGANGKAGRVLLIGGTEPQQPARPSAYVDMSRMDFAPVKLSVNNWETRRGGGQLFKPGSVVSDTYLHAAGRTAVDYVFRWDVARPLVDFTGWSMLVKMENGEPKLYLPDGLWWEGEKTIEEGKVTYAFKKAAKSTEVGRISWGGASGHDGEHTVRVADAAGLSAIVNTAVHLEYQTLENGRYVVRYNAAVPAEALIVAADGVRVALGRLGIDAKRLEIGTSAFARLTVTRSLGSNSVRYQMSANYRIKAALTAGQAVETRVASELMSGNTIVGRLPAGERLVAASFNGDWVSVTKPDGTALRGWISVYNLRPVQSEDE